MAFGLHFVIQDTTSVLRALIENTHFKNGIDNRRKLDETASSKTVCLYVVRPMQFRACVLTVAAALLTVAQCQAADRLPNEAVAVISKVHAASARKDFGALRRLMVAEFTWSFGGDGNAEQALAEWQENPAALARLRHVTGQSCGHITREIIQCPRRAGAGSRAGFQSTPDGWRMVYFVTGD